MKYIFLVGASLTRKKTRTILTLLSVMIAFVLFGLLQSVRQGFSGGAQRATVKRLIVTSKYAMTDLLPVTAQMSIAAVPQVEATAFATFFLGTYQGKAARFSIYPVVPDDYMRVYPEMELAPQQLAAWKATRTGAIADADLAARMRWKVGERISVQSEMWPTTSGSTTWTVDLVGTFSTRNKRSGGQSALLFRHDFFDQARMNGRGTVGWFLVRVADPAAAEQIGQRIDALSANSGHETKTESEQAFAQSFARQFGDIGLIVGMILAASFFSLLLATANTMSLSLRERIPELGMLKTLGFSNRTVCLLVLAESVTLSVAGAAVGLALAAGLLSAMGDALAGLGVSTLSLPVVVQAGALALALGLAVGLPPALRAMRIGIVDALRA